MFGALVAMTLVVLGVTTWLVITTEPAQRPAYRTVPATVVVSASCGVPGSRDLLEIRVDGRTRAAVLDGCGQPAEAELEVEIPVPPPPVGLVPARLPGTGDPDATPGALPTAVLTALAGLAGGLLTLLVLVRTVSRRPAVR